DRRLVGIAVLEMDIQTIGGHIQLTVVEPPVERRIRFIQHPGEWLGPLQVLTCQPCPEPFEVPLGLVAQGMVGGHSADVCRRAQIRWWRKNPLLYQYRLYGVCHFLTLSQKLDSGTRSRKRPTPPAPQYRRGRFRHPVSTARLRR